MGIYEPLHHISMWKDTFKGDSSPNTGASSIVEVDVRLDSKSDHTSHESQRPSRNDQEASKPSEKIQRRLAQNREAARKSRMRKKAYIQQLESSRLKLLQLENELHRAKQQGLYVGGAVTSSHVGVSGSVNPGIVAFEIEYGNWVEEQHRQICELRNALQTRITDIELRILVESGLSHYYNLFRIKSDAAKADVFYLISGIWRTPVERLFFWLGGFRPSELLSVLIHQLEPLTDQQLLDVGNLRKSSRQAEEALTKGIEKLQETLTDSIASHPLGSGSYGPQMAMATENLEALECFVNQADHLRQQALYQLYQTLTTRQAARGLLALGEYFHRLRALSSLWVARPSGPT